MTLMPIIMLSALSVLLHFYFFSTFSIGFMYSSLRG